MSVEYRCTYTSIIEVPVYVYLSIIRQYNPDDSIQLAIVHLVTVWLWHNLLWSSVIWEGDVHILVELSKMKLAFGVSDHVSECNKTSEGLCEYKYGKNYMNASFQWLYENGFVKKLEQD